jgi:hypothetical protein
MAPDRPATNARRFWIAAEAAMMGRQKSDQGQQKDVAVPSMDAPWCPNKKVNLPNWWDGRVTTRASRFPI